MYLCTRLMCICERVCYDAPNAHTRGRVHVRTIRLCTACAPVRRPLFMRPSRWNTFYMVFLDTINAHSYIDAHSNMEDRSDHRCVRAPQTRARAALMCARVWVRVRWRTQPRRTVRARSVGVDRVRLRRAGVFVLLSVGFQRGHRRVEHRACRLVGRRMRRFWPATYIHIYIYI